MERIVVDASIIVKWFIKEQNSDLALKIRDRFVDGQLELLAPDLLHYEILNALKYSKLFSQDNLASAAASLENYGITQFPLIGDYAQEVVKLAEEYNLSIYDAAYIGLTNILDVCAYSADKKLVDKIRVDYENKILFITDLDK